MSKILVVNFTFPPYPGIGARRWAKFAKYLHRGGHEIAVFSAMKIPGDTSPWMEDIAEFKDRVHYMKPPFPRILNTIPKNVLQKIRYKLALEYVKIKYAEGNYFDPSSGFGKRISGQIQKYVDAGYSNLVVSCGPFHMAHELISIKQKNPGVKFILDFRDPWANNRTSFGFLTISKEQLAREFEMEKETIAAADYVVSVSAEMSEYFSGIAPGSGDKFITLDNGFDKEDFADLGRLTNAQTDKLRFVFTGTLYDKSREIFTEFVEALKKLNHADHSMYQSMRFDFYGAVPTWFYAVTSGVKDILQFHGEVGLKQVYGEISSSDIGMLFLTGDLTYSRSTKFYEYLAMGKPIAVFSKGGATGKFVSEKNIGFALNTGEMEAALRGVFDRWRAGQLPQNAGMDITAWDVANLFQKWIPLLN